MKRFLLAAAAALIITPGHALEWELEGSIEPEYQVFLESGSLPAQHQTNASIALEAEFNAYWDNEDQRVRVKPFWRGDWRDSNRTHFDLREAKWHGIFEDFELRVGLDKVFWGVLETAHIVDIINQTDFVDSPDGEDKLGQPMVMVSVERDWGTVDAFVLPYFRERTLPGPQGRPAPDVIVDTNLTRYESGAQRHHVDYALRYSTYFDDYDIGISHFHGTGRDPILEPVFVPGRGVVFRPFYPQIDQTGLDAQATLGSWLLKLEAYSRHENSERHLRLGTGVEYTFYGIFATDGDLGLIGEYLFDDRHRGAPHAFDNDLFFGLRWAANDVQSTQILAGSSVDMTHQGLSLFIEASRRIGENYLLSVEMRAFTGVPAAGDPLSSFRDDDFVQIRMARYF